MILTDYLRSDYDITWDFAKQCGVENGVIRLPETKDFDITDRQHWKTVYKRFIDFGIKPLVIEPMPNELHEHIKSGDGMRDDCIQKVIKMMELMDELDIRLICFNWMAHIGWLRTSVDYPERGGARVTAFCANDINIKEECCITEKDLWDNYEYFIKAIIPYTEKYNIKLALHPDDPPLSRISNVSRIMISKENIERAVNIVDSKMLGITMCQATYEMMGEDLYSIIPYFADRIMFIHFRNVVGDKYNFHESFHDNGQIDMAKMMRLYKECKIDVPIRVDHVPTMAGEESKTAGYDALGRLFAIGYLKGMLECLF